MQILDLVSVCGNHAIVPILAVFVRALDILHIIAPILLLVGLGINIFKLVKFKDAKEEKQLRKNITNQVVATVVIFLLPYVVNLLMWAISQGGLSVFDVADCWDKAKNTTFASSTSYKKPGSTYRDGTLVKITDDEIGEGSDDVDPNKIYKEKEKARQAKRNNSSSNSSNNSSGSSSDNHSIESSYGVFLGLDHDDGINKLLNYKLVVIDLQEFNKDDIDKLHEKGIKVYSYLNIGSVEEYRNYYNRFKDYYLGTYENWEDERWVDVSKKSFQDFIINELEPSLRNKGADGYFIDNCDVYANFKNDKIYNGLKTILRSVHSHNLPVLINGGDEFVSKAIKDGSYNSLFDGVNQEEVFTVINFNNHTYKNQSASETKYYKDYLKNVKSKGLIVYLLEYGASSSKEKEIANYCNANGFSYYNSSSYNLD